MFIGSKVRTVKAPKGSPLELSPLFLFRAGVRGGALIATEGAVQCAWARYADVSGVGPSALAERKREPQDIRP